jgi:PST family polysaccharide transporter
MTRHAGMGRKALGGAVYTGAAQALTVLFTMLSTIVVARILSPSDYGVIAMAAPITNFIMLFQNLGLAQAVIQARTVSPAQLNGLFWVNIAASGVIAITFLLISPLVGWFYGDARAGYIVAASAATVLVGGTVLQHQALINRELRFRALSIATAAMVTANFAATVVAALLLRSYWALWLGSFAGVVVNAIVLWSLNPWRPSLTISMGGTREMLKFGAGVTGFNLFNFISRNLDNVLIAQAWGSTAVGLYDRAYKLMMFPIQNINGPVSQVMLPILSRLNQEPARFRRAFVMAAQAIQLAAIPGMAVAVASSDDLIPFLLSDRWAAAAPIFFWLGLNALIQPLANSAGWLFVASGRTGALMWWGAVSSALTVLSFVIGLKWGPVGVAIAYFIGAAMRTPFLYHIAVRGTSVRAGDFYRMQLLSLASAGAIFALTRVVMIEFSIVPTLCIALPSAYLLAFAAQGASKSGRDLFSTCWDFLSDKISRKSEIVVPQGERAGTDRT